MNAASPASAGAPHVLVIDAVPEIASLLREILEEGGFRVSAVHRPLDPSEIRALAPDLIVTDVIFDGEVAGWRFLPRWRLDPVLARVPVVVCTGALDAVRGLAAELPAEAFLVVLKPFNIDQLLEKVSGSLPLADPVAPGAWGASPVTTGSADRAAHPLPDHVDQFPDVDRPGQDRHPRPGRLPLAPDHDHRNVPLPDAIGQRPSAGAG